MSGKANFSWIKSSADKIPDGNWFVEWFSKGEFHAHKISHFIASSKTKFQEVTLFDTPAFGKCLVIDAETQSTQSDEYIYHESLVCPAVIAHPSPKTALMLGGGEGATAREVLNCRAVEKAVMVDIDYHVLDFAQKHMPTWHRGSFSNPKLSLLVQNAEKFVAGTMNKFDLIYSDLPSPIEGGPAFRMYTLEFYRKLKKILNTNGVFALQSGPGTHAQLDLHAAITGTLKKVFRSVESCVSYIPGYDMPWAFSIASDKTDLNFTRRENREMDSAIEKKFFRKPKFIDAVTIKGIFNLPLPLREKIRTSKKTITLKKPLFFTTSHKV